jgi:hypothetical protein
MFVRKEDVMKPNPVAARAAQPLALTLSLILLAGCGSAAASRAADPAASPSTSSPAAAEPATATTPTNPTTTGSPPATRTEPSSGDVAAAVQSALGLFEKVPRKAGDPAAGYLWGPAGDASAHLSREVAGRLAALRSSGYFSDRVCAADYFTGTMNLLEAAPSVVSARGESNGTVTVVIRRPASPAPPNLTLVMARRNGVWLATQLASGSGPSASIFAAKPNC